MENQNIKSFLAYYEKIRKRTWNVVSCIPPNKIEWSYKEGKFTFGDLVRHIATIERYMYAENAQLKKSCYPGYGKELADGYENVMKFFDQMHKESMDIFSGLSDQDLQKKCTTPDGATITVWKWLRSMIEHEIHHRGQIYLYLGMIDIPTPPLYGLTSEEVFAKSQFKYSN